MPKTQLHLPEVKNLSQTIADQLANMIQNGRLKPGEHLVQLDLANQLHVSRAAVRDALHLLCQQGLAINRPRGGTVVRSVSIGEVREIFEIRRLLEGLAAERACENMSIKELEHLSQIITDQERLAEKPDPEGLLAKDREFHNIIFEHTHNKTLQDLIDTLWSRTSQARSLAQVDLKWAQNWGKKSAKRHRQIHNALQKRDAQKTKSLVIKAIDQAEKELIKGLKNTDWGKE